MPSFDGITLALISQYDACTVPEYAPPRSSDPFTESVNLYDHDARMITAYVPIYPFSQFWLSYEALPGESEAEIQYFYFKLFINGNHIVSWGCGEENEWKGKTMFGLFQGHSDSFGRSTQVIESRALYFNKGSNGQGVDINKDAMLVKVYRGKGRRRIGPTLEPFASSAASALDIHNKRSREKPGALGLFNAGPLMYGQPKRYYKYALADPIDQPFLTFRYLHRTVEQLTHVGIVAEDDLSEVFSSKEQAESSTPRKLRVGKLPTSLSLRSFTTSVASDADIKLPLRYPMPVDAQGSPSPLRIPAALSSRHRHSQGSSSAFPGIENGENGIPSMGTRSLYLNKNSPLSWNTGTGPTARSASLVDSSALGLRPSNEQLFRNAVSALMQKTPARGPTTSPQHSPTPPPHRGRLFLKSSIDSLRSLGSSPSRRGRSATPDASTTELSGTATAPVWINDIFEKARARAEKRLEANSGKIEREKEEKEERRYASEGSPPIQVHAQIMGRLAGAIVSAKRRQLEKRAQTPDI